MNVKKMIAVFCLGLLFVESESIKAASEDSGDEDEFLEADEEKESPTSSAGDSRQSIYEKLNALNLELDDRQFEIISNIIYETFSSKYNISEVVIEDGLEEGFIHCSIAGQFWYFRLNIEKILSEREGKAGEKLSLFSQDDYKGFLRVNYKEAATMTELIRRVGDPFAALMDDSGGVLAKFSSDDCPLHIYDDAKDYDAQVYNFLSARSVEAIGASLVSVVAGTVAMQTTSLPLKMSAGIFSAWAAGQAVARSTNFFHLARDMGKVEVSPSERLNAFLGSALVCGLFASVSANVFSAANYALGTDIPCWTAPAVMVALATAGAVKRACGHDGVGLQLSLR